VSRILCGKNIVASNACDDRNMHQATDELMTVSAAAKALSISEGGVRVKADRGELPCIRTTTGLRLFHRRDVQQHAVRSKSARAAEGSKMR
jgi:excisionase family DNA binding protein